MKLSWLELHRKISLVLTVITMIIVNAINTKQCKLDTRLYINLDCIVIRIYCVQTDSIQYFFRMAILQNLNVAPSVFWFESRHFLGYYGFRKRDRFYKFHTLKCKCSMLVVNLKFLPFKSSIQCNIINCNYLLRCTNF